MKVVLMATFALCFRLLPTGLKPLHCIESTEQCHQNQSALCCSHTVDSEPGRSALAAATNAITTLSPAQRPPERNQKVPLA